MKETSGLIGVMHGISDGLEKVINFFCCIFVSAIAIAVVVQVLGREINIPVVWLGELSTYCLVWVVFFGLAIGYKNGLFAQVDLITHVIPIDSRKYLSLLWDAIGLLIMGIILWSSKDYILNAYKGKTTSPELGIPLYLVYMGPVLGYLFTSYFSLVNIVDKIRQIAKGKESEGGGTEC